MIVKKEMMIRNITSDSFEKYGWILDFSEDIREPVHFEIICDSDSKGWRIAMYNVRQKTAFELEQHPESMESFEPFSGCGVLLVSADVFSSGIDAFLLDRPICLKKGIWHQLITLSRDCTVKIMENKTVSSNIYKLEKPISCALIEEE